MAYRAGRQLTSVEDAKAILAVHGEPVMRVERIALDAADQRVLAANLIAHHDVPRFARSMMDGYAVRSADTAGATPGQPVTLRLVERIYTGRMPANRVDAGGCAGIATGAPMPAGADAVVMVEHAALEAGLASDGPDALPLVNIVQAVAPRQHVGRAGSDLVAGEMALSEGTVLSAARLGVIAALGLNVVDVYQRPRVAILSTGDEIVAPGGTVGPAQIFDSNTAALCAAIRLHGGEPVVAPRVGDNRAALTTAFEQCLSEDVVLFSGGTSVGDRDFLLEIITAAGTVHFEGLRLKPGKPTVFATVAGRPVFGMPGNPVSCLTNAYLLVAPLLRRMAHLPPVIDRVVLARLADDVESPAGRHQIYPVRVEGPAAIPVFKGSGEITSLAHADGYFEIPADVESMTAGTVVEVTLF